MTVFRVETASAICFYFEARVFGWSETSFAQLRGSSDREETEILLVYALVEGGRSQVLARETGSCLAHPHLVVCLEEVFLFLDYFG